MSNSNNLNIGFVAQSQTQKEVTINEAIAALDALQNRGVADKDLTTPPGSPENGVAYIVPASATGAWSGKTNNVAYYNNGWRFIQPKEGLILWVNDEDSIYCFNGTSWVEYASEGGGGGDPEPVTYTEFGINATADSTNRLSVNSDAILFNNDGDDVRVKLNKHASADTASFLYQKDFSGRAEIGLCGDDNFHFKVSPNGSTWYDAMVINRNNGKVSFLDPHVKTTVKTTSDSTNTSNISYVAVDGLSFTLEASKIYLVEFYMAYITNSTACGIEFVISIPTGASIIAGDNSGASSITAAQTTQLTGHLTASASFTATSSASTNSLMKMTVLVDSGSTGGTIQPYFRNEVSGAVLTVKEKSVGRLICMN